MVGLENIIIDAIDTNVDAKMQLFDRTIQAIVKDNSDINKIGEIKVFYKDATFSAYTDVKSVNNYKVGSHVYVTIPNNDMTERKRIAGLVEKTGPLVLTNNYGQYDVQGQYSEPNIVIQDNNIDFNEFKMKWVFMRTAGGWIINEIKGDSLDTLFSPSIKDRDKKKAMITTFISNLDSLVLRSNFLRFSMFLDVSLEDIYRNSNNWGYQLGIHFYSSDLNVSEPIAGDYFTIDDVTGDPFCQKEQQQTLLIDTSNIANIDDFDIIELSYFRRSYTVDEEENQNFLNNFIRIFNFSIEAVTPLSISETDELFLTIATPRGKTFLDTTKFNQSAENALQLRAEIKDNGIWVDNNKVQCWWFKRNPSVQNLDSSEDYYNIKLLGGSGWELIETFNDKKELVSKNSISIHRDDLGGATEKEYKAIGIYNGVRLNALVTLYDANNPNPYSIVVTEERAGISKFTINTQAQSSYKGIVSYKWFYYSDGGTYSLIEQGNNQNSISINQQNYRYSGTIKCEIYHEKNGEKQFFTSLSALYNPEISNDILFYNFEQVFLYDVKGNITLLGEISEDNFNTENKYATTIKIPSISGQVEEIAWYIPKNNTLLDGSQYRNNVDVEEDDNYYIVKNKMSLSLLSIKSTYDDATRKGNILNNNILIKYKVHSNGEDIVETRVTNFTFLKEGEDGTNGSGYVCRIVPNVEEGESIPEVVIVGLRQTDISGSGETESSSSLTTKIQFNFVPKGLTNITEPISDKNDLFRVQVWKQNQKLFDNVKMDTDENFNIKSLRWTLIDSNSSNSYFYLQSEKYPRITGGNGSKISYLGIENNIPPAIEGMKVNINYDTTSLSYTLPIITYWDYSNEGKNIKNQDLSSILSNYHLITRTISIDFATKFYYDETGQNNSTKKVLNIGKESIDILPISLSKHQNYNDIQIRGNNEVESSDFIFTKNQIIIGAEGNNNNDYCFLIPIFPFILRIADSLLTDWNGQQVEIQEDDGEILTQYVMAGSKDLENTFSGGILGDYKNKEKNGLVLYNQGVQTVYLNSYGNIEFGTNPNDKLIIDGNKKTIGNGLQNSGLILNFDSDSMEFNYNEHEFLNIDREAQLREGIGNEDIVKAIKITKANNTLFTLTENGTLQTKTIIGKYQKYEWYQYPNEADQTIKYLEIPYKTFITEEGIAGFEGILVGTHSVNSSNIIEDGVEITHSSISHGCKGIKDGRLLSSGGFYLGKNGIVTGDGNGHWAGLLPTGDIIGKTLVIGEGNDVLLDASARLHSFSKSWRITKDSILGPDNITSIGKDYINTPNLRVSSDIYVDSETKGRDEPTIYIGQDGKRWQANYRHGIKIEEHVVDKDEKEGSSFSVIYFGQDGRLWESFYRRGIRIGEDQPYGGDNSQVVFKTDLSSLEDIDAKFEDIYAKFEDIYARLPNPEP